MVTWPRLSPRPYMIKPFKYLLLWNQKANGLWTCYVALGMWALPDLHKWWIWVDLWPTSRSDWFLMHLYGKMLKCSFFYNCSGRNHNTCKKCLTYIMRQWFYISTKCQADMWPFIQGHSFGLPHTYLNIFFSEITGLFVGVSLDCFRSLDQNGRNPHKTEYVSL